MGLRTYSVPGTLSFGIFSYTSSFDRPVLYILSLEEFEYTFIFYPYLNYTTKRNFIEVDPYLKYSTRRIFIELYTSIFAFDHNSPICRGSFGWILVCIHRIFNPFIFWPMERYFNLNLYSLVERDLHVKKRSEFLKANQASLRVSFKFGIMCIRVILTNNMNWLEMYFFYVIKKVII